MNFEFTNNADWDPGLNLEIGNLYNLKCENGN
jgi:hypothetical protein